MSKKRILILSDWFLPAYKAGGPVRSIANIVSHLKSDFDFYILTSDRDLGDTEAYATIDCDRWIAKDQFSIQYLSPANRSYQSLKTQINKLAPEVVYLNSMFSFSFTILPLVILKLSRPGIKIILAPRGMLGKGALGIKPMKKKLFLVLGRIFGLFKAIQWQATSLEEKEEIQKVFGRRALVVVVKNIPQEFLVDHRNKERGLLKLLFYSRISKKKNLLEGLRILEKGDFNGQISFDIIGPVEGKEYWEECNKVIKTIEKLKSNVIVNIIGAINTNDVIQYFQKNQLFFLPTRHENFGHVIAEVLSSSMPVLISDQTPWRKLEKEQVGFDISLSNEGAFIKAINLFLQMDQEEYNKWSTNARTYFEKQINLDSIVSDTRNVFLSE